jgi:hypothetical protein
MTKLTPSSRPIPKDVKEHNKTLGSLKKKKKRKRKKKGGWRGSSSEGSQP